jgi:hypothetical protein
LEQDALMLLSSYTHGEEIGFAMAEQMRGSKHARTVAIHDKLGWSRPYLNIKLSMCSYYTKINLTIFKMKEAEELM